MKVLIFGLGLNQGGVGSARFFASQGASVKVTDLKTADVLKPSLKQLKGFPKITCTLSKHKYEDIDWADLIVKNPAVKPGNPYIEYAIKQGKKVETDMGIFLKYARPDQIIGITGTKGKSTTASLIYEILEKYLRVNPTHTRGGIRTHRWNNVVLAGNIGKSVLDTIPYVKKDTLVVLEISSFQLESFDTHKVSPKWAIITNIYPDHLNYYESMDQYIAAKKIIGQHQTPSDFLFINKDDSLSNNTQFFKNLKGQIIFYSASDLPKGLKPTLVAEHNKTNMAAAVVVGKTFNINPTLLLNTLANFKGIPFRMELIKEWNGVKIYNDTAATSPESGIQAIVTLGAKLVHPPGGLILICGGMNKKMDYTKYATAIAKFVKKVFFLEGDSTEEIKSLVDQNLIAGTYNNLEKLLTDVKEFAKPGDIVLFSPAATSFNLFQNEFDRGRKFNGAVRKVFSDYCTLYLVRHGQTDWNANGITQGQADIPLNSEGIKQAQALGETLRKIKFDAVFSSDLVRAKKTAEILALERKMAIETTRFLRERRYGKFDGKPWQLMQEFYDTWVSLSKEKRMNYRPYKDYETDEEVISRFITFLRETAVRYTGKTVLIVCHGSMLRTLLNHLSEETYLLGAVSNSGYIKLKSDGVNFFIKELKGIKNPDV